MQRRRFSGEPNHEVAGAHGSEAIALSTVRKSPPLAFGNEGRIHRESGRSTVRDGQHGEADRRGAQRGNRNLHRFAGNDDI